MAYSTPALVRQALVATLDGSLPVDPTLTAADLSDDQLSDAVLEASALIDGYIGGFYAVPVADNLDGTVPSPVNYWCRTIAAYLATCTYRGSQDFADTDPVARRYKDTLLALQMVAKGTMKLQVPTNTGPNASAGAGNTFNPYIGDLWCPEDFSVNTAPIPGSGYGGSGYDGFWQQ